MRRVKLLCLMTLGFRTARSAFYMPPPRSSWSWSALSDRMLLRTNIQRHGSRHDDVEFAMLEREVLASAQARMDSRRLRAALDDDTTNNNSAVPSRPTVQDQWKIALAASLVGSFLSFAVTRSLELSAIILGAIFMAANGDPLDEDNLAGALARAVGRVTITSVEASQPRVKALARAVITGEEEIVALKTRVRELEEENRRLMLWKERRIKVDETASQYSLEELKEQARVCGLMIGGTKSQLMMRLLEAEALDQ